MRIRTNNHPSSTLRRALLAVLPPGASARIFGTNPLNISTTPGGGAANGGSGQPSVSGDNRKITLVSFFSDASNLVGGDTNGTRDIFVWHRPRGATGRALNRLGVGRLHARASVGTGQANGPSENPTTDGSMNHRAHCVAFQSRATNLSPLDATPDLDIYLRDLRARKTYLVSRRSAGEAMNPSISGSCKKSRTNRMERSTSPRTRARASALSAPARRPTTRSTANR